MVIAVLRVLRAVENHKHRNFQWRGGEGVWIAL